MATFALQHTRPRRTRHNARTAPLTCYRALTAQRNKQMQGQAMTKTPTMPPGCTITRRARTAIALLALFGSATAAPAPDAARAQVYRCQAPDGAIEFRQEPCPAGSQGESLTIEDRQTGWTLVPKDQAARPGPVPKAPKKAASQRRPAGPSARERREQECRKKRQQAEDIDRRLRLGTSGRQGSDLRHRRGRLEDFLYEYCE